MDMFIHFFCLCPLNLAIKLNLNISKVTYSHCGKSNVSQNTRLIDRTTEILLTLKKSHKEENKLPPNSKIQDFTLVRYVTFCIC